LIQHNSWELIDFDIARNSEAKRCGWEVPGYAVAHQRDLRRAKGEARNFLSWTAAIIPLINHIDDLVGPGVYGADLVVHDHIAITTVIREERVISPDTGKRRMCLGTRWPT
jgi:hypothetical protein